MRVGKPVLKKIEIEKDNGKTEEVLHIAFPVEEYFEARKMYNKLTNSKAARFELTVTNAKKKRSDDQNELMWKLCQLIAEAVGITKKEVYREHIRDYGEWESVLVKRSGADALKRQWESNGVGWIAEEIDENNGIVKLRLYAGSSTYDTAQMKRLIDSLMDECRSLCIEVDERLASLYGQI